VNIKIAGKWMFIPLKMVLIGIDPYPYPEAHGGSKSLDFQGMEVSNLIGVPMGTI